MVSQQVKKLASTSYSMFSKNDKQKTVLEKLESNENGFIVPTFNKALQSLVEEIYAFQED